MIQKSETHICIITSKGPINSLVSILYSHFYLEVKPVCILECQTIIVLFGGVNEKNIYLKFFKIFFNFLLILRNVRFKV